MRILPLAALVAPLVVVGPSPISAQAVGTAVSVVKQVGQIATSGGAVQPVRNGDAIYYGRILTAGTGSRGEFELLDKTRLVLNSGSSIELDDLVVASANSFSKVAVNGLSGAFRFITGDSPKDAYQIKTAVATLGIRGTKFDVYVGRGRVAAVMLLEGALKMCDVRGRCQDLTRSCEIAVSAPNQAVQKVDGSQGVAGVPLAAAFPLAADQRGLSREAQVAGAERCTARAALRLPDSRQPQRAASARADRQRTSVAARNDPSAPDDPDTPDDDPGVSEPGGNPGTSGRTPGASRSAGSNASETARSNPGRSESSNAGGRGKGRGQANNPG